MLVVSARAQFEIKGGSFDNLFQQPIPDGGSPAAVLPQFSSVTSITGGTGPLKITDAQLTDTNFKHSSRYPGAIYLVGGNGAANGEAMVLSQASFGGSFAVGVPRYLLGEVIARPDTKYDGVTTADEPYWRRQPVAAGELFTQADSTVLTPVPAQTTPAFYYSPHADKVFATHAGRVAITWVTRLPEGGNYLFKQEIFTVSSATQRAVRTIYWTERTFNGPKVNVPLGSIETINPVYSSAFPATVAEEYKQVGASTNTEPSATAAAEKRTLWFQKEANVGQLRAYNLEGRIFIEYLGVLKPGTLATHQFLGADIVEVARVAPSFNVEVKLGEKITPRDKANQTAQPTHTVDWIGDPVLAISPDTQAYYGSNTRADKRVDYYAERENDNPDRVVFYWLEQADAAIHFLPAAGTTSPIAPNLALFWPKVRNNYRQVWPTTVAEFAHYTVSAGGSTAGTSVQFGGGQMPQIIFQDDATQTEARIDQATQRFQVIFAGDAWNRSLLKFTNGNQVWYVRLFTQAEGRLDRDGLPAFQQGDGTAAIKPPDATTATAFVGQRINPPADHSAAGYIVEGRGYHPTAYIDPFAAGAIAAERGAIIPVNAIPTKNELKIWWFKKVEPPNALFSAFYVPAKIGLYRVAYPPATPPDYIGEPKIVMASNDGSGPLSGPEIAGGLYVQNEPNDVGFNPNEEHAVMLAGRAYALRDDLNITSGAGYTSEPFVLVNTILSDGRPGMRTYRVLRELDLPGTANDVLFDDGVTAGKKLPMPMPLEVMPLAVDAAGKVKNVEVEVSARDLPANGASPGYYSNFTFKDRKGAHWVYRGPHAGGSPTLGMQFYYAMVNGPKGYYIPDPALPNVRRTVADGKLLPYLRPLTNGVPTGDQLEGPPLTILYRPQWPEFSSELQVGETLTEANHGLPGVYTQASALVLYQQSVAVSAKPSVTLHDPIRQKLFSLTKATLDKLPESALTTSYQGKIYFQKLPPHLQTRFYFNPLGGPKDSDGKVLGQLVLIGQLKKEIIGDSYLHLNVLSEDDETALKELVSSSPADARRAQWLAAIAALTTTVETFVQDPEKVGSFKSNGSPTTVGAKQLAAISNSDTAVTNYAVTAQGEASGWVTMVFANGENTDRVPTGDPVAMGVFRVAPHLYPGELKVIESSNPLDEQVTLRHSGDFAARPGDYVFQWRYAPPQDSKAPPIYDGSTMIAKLGTDWKLAASPAEPPAAAGLPTEYPATSTTLAAPIQIYAPGFVGAGSRPGLVARSTTGVDFSGGKLGNIVFSATLADHAGFVLYVNGVEALAFRVPSPFVSATPRTTDLVADGLSLQFPINGSFFQVGVNRIEVALYSTGTVGGTTNVNFKLHAAVETDMVAGSTTWQTPNGTLLNQAIVGGSATAPLGSPLLVMSDNYFTMRYRPKKSADNNGRTNVANPSDNDEAWSRWLQPQLVQGWIKRVLAGINPFNTRMRDLYNNAVTTDVSLLTQAGKRWEGNIALTLENINDVGLIEIYETVLNRGKAMSIDNGYDYDPANDALLLVAGYLNDLYTILGNEAFADAANPTISIDDSTTVTEVNTSRFSFEAQVKTVLDEELALLRGRDNSANPTVDTKPAYNRLFWNYTRGINSGEALYAVNYNIREKAGSSTADGVVDAADAQRMFPQGHGDAYGHYLTALKGYYRLLRNPKFTWEPRSEEVLVLGKAVTIDYQDERKFADAAANVARTAQQVLALTHRQSYKDEPAAGWSHFRDTNGTRQWGLDEWAARATQGSYFHWVVGNAILPDHDTIPGHTGVAKIDRTTVPSLRELAAVADSFQTTVDNASANLNPLGLSPGAIAFDISPAELKAGKSHYEQIYDRSLRAVLNAKGAFDQAAKMTRLLRNQENQVDNYSGAIVDQERAYVKQLIEIYGTPYPGSVGPGRTYAQGYTGPDTDEWFIVDRPTDIVETTKPVTVSLRLPVGVKTFTGFELEDIKSAYDGEAALVATTMRTVTIQPNRHVQYSDVWPASGGALGLRSVTGSLQQALLDSHQEQLTIEAANEALKIRAETFKRRHKLFLEMIRVRTAAGAREAPTAREIARLRRVEAALSDQADWFDFAGDTVGAIGGAFSDGFPKVVGLANDVTSPARAAVWIAFLASGSTMKGLAVANNNRARELAIQQSELQEALDGDLGELGLGYEDAQMAYEYEAMFRTLTQSYHEIAQLATNLQRANERVGNLLAEGERIKEDRQIFRQRAAALIQGYRTKDLTFRTFRNEALEQYRSLFDLASRYTFLAAKSYDYETGLLGSTAGQEIVSGIVAARSLGDLSGGVPQATVSTLGDAGLAGTMARLQADWSVAKGRLGINNPDENGTLFSLRRELFQHRDSPGTTDADAAWQQTLEQHIMSDVLSDPDVAALCRNLRKPDGSAVPGIVLPFGTTIEHGFNFFGSDLGTGDHAFSTSNFATKIYSVGMVMRGYVGMDTYSAGTPNAGIPNSTAPNALSATPYVFLIPIGVDKMLAPPLGDTGAVREFIVRDQALPLPFNLGATQFSASQFFNANGTLSEVPWVLRKHQAFRPVSEPTFFYGSVPAEFTSSRLVGRSVWNTKWKIVIPAYTLLKNEQEGLNRFVASVKDIELFLRTYSHSGN